MNDASEYDWGQRVLAAIDLFNDGSHPESAADSLLVPVGTPGEVVQVGLHEASRTSVYMVEFLTDVAAAASNPYLGRRVVGCLSHELAHAPADRPTASPMDQPIPAACAQPQGQAQQQEHGPT